jgi:hypothetical protein
MQLSKNELMKICDFRNISSKQEEKLYSKEIHNNFRELKTRIENRHTRMQRMWNRQEMHKHNLW